MAKSPAQRQAERAARQAQRAQRRQSQQAAQYAQIQANQKRNSQNLAQYAADWEAGRIPFGPSGEPNPAAVGGPPLDPQFEAHRASAGRNLQLAEGEGAYQRGQAEQFYGYGVSGAANPYSQAALLEESFKRSKLGTTNAYASMGQHNSGAYDRMQGENARNYSIQSDQNRRAYDQAVHGINYGQAQAAANYGVGMDDEAFNALRRALGLA